MFKTTLVPERQALTRKSSSFLGGGRYNFTKKTQAGKQTHPSDNNILINTPTTPLPSPPPRLRDLAAQELGLKAAPASPVPGLPLEERPDGAEVALVAQEVSLLGAFTPELDGVAEGVHGLGVAADEAAAEVNVGEVVDLALEEGDLADVVTNGVEE